MKKGKKTRLRRRKMKEEIRKAVEQYQCTGCVSGSSIECYTKASLGCGCENHCAGTLILGIGHVFLGMPKGFDRKGPVQEQRVIIFESIESRNKQWSDADVFTVNVWKYQNVEGDVFIRGYMPRINRPFLQVILGVPDESAIFAVHLITEEDFENMD